MKKKILLSLLVVVLAIFGYFWWRSGFTFEISRFFAVDNPDLAPQIVLSPGGPYVHGQTFNIAWSRNDAESCDSVNGWVNTGGANQGNDDSPAINACAASQGAVGIRCTFANNETGYRSVSFSINQSTCPSATHLACVNYSCQIVSGSGANEGGCTFVNQSCGTPPTSDVPCSSGTCQSSCNATTEDQVGTCRESGVSKVCCSPKAGGGGDYCSSCPDGGDKWIENGVGVCIISGNLSTDQLCTTTSSPVTRTLCIKNKSGGGIYRRPALFYCPFLTCSALDNHSGPGCGNTYPSVTGPANIANNDEGTVTYSFTPNCGSYQLDDTWGGYTTVFVIGNVINSGTACPTPTATPQHLACVSNACALVDGGGGNTDGCTTAGQVCGVTPQHLACVSNACALVDGGGGNTDGCTTAGQVCGVTPQHLACVSNACALVDGGGGNTDGCTTAGQVCGTTPTHTECNNDRACVSVTGAGQNQCSTNADCAVATHTECNASRACVSVSGAGQNQCSTNADCAVVRELVCAPVNQTVAVGQTAQVQASGGTGPYGWAAPGSALLQQNGANASVRYSRSGTFTVAVQDSAGRSAVCYIVIQAVQTTVLPPPTFPALQIDKLVRNVTRSSAEQDSVTANPGNTVEFALRVSSTGSGTVTSVTVRDSLPAGLTYVPGSTTVDGIAAADGIISSGLALGDMPAGRTITIRFRATVSPASFFSTGTTVLTNTGYVRGSNAPEVSDTAFVIVTRGVPAQVQTGPGETTALALIVASIITLLYVGYTGTDAFRRRALLNDIDVARRDKDQFNFKK